MNRYTFFMYGKTTFCKDAHFFQIDLQNQCISTMTRRIFLKGNLQVGSKIHIKMQRTLKENGKVRGLTLSNFETYYRTIVIKTMWCRWPKRDN